MVKIVLIIVFFFIPSLSFASVAGEVNKANDLYLQGKFDDSLDLYQKALDQGEDSSVVKYDLGTAYYKKGDYEKALGYLTQAAGDKNLKIKPKAEYNLGNVLYKSGIQKENSNVDEAIGSLQKALGEYSQSASDDPKDADAKFNADFVKKEIQRLKQKKKQEQQQQKKQQQQNQKPKDQKQGEQGQKDQQKQEGGQNQQQQQKQQQKQQQQQQRNQQQKQRQAKQDQQKKNDQQKAAQAQADQSQKDIDRKQAEDSLEDYRENEEPKKLLDYMPKKSDDRPVIKDW